MVWAMATTFCTWNGFIQVRVRVLILKAGVI